MTPPLEQWREELRTSDLTPARRAAIHGRQANEALKRCRRYVAGWLAHADPESGLIPRNLRPDGRGYWNGRDSAADNYSFMVLTCALTDRPLFEGHMRDMLRTETSLTSRVGALPADYSFEKKGFRFAEPDIDRLIFDGSEYVKDGLMPITEWLGPSPWSERMLAIVDSILEHSPVETPAGPIPSTNGEVNGEMMQVLSRLHFMTGDAKYLDMACRIADYHLLGDRHPTRHARTLRLRDHGCELISGLTEVYAACHFARKDRKNAYREPVHQMLDRILEVAVNDHGRMFDRVDPVSGKVLSATIGDNWGYNYNGFYTVFLVDRTERYRDAVRHVLATLWHNYRGHQRGSDSIADSVEGAINLYNREPVESAAFWIDHEIARMLEIQKPDGVVEGWHGDGNYARTAIMWALWKQLGTTTRPWREDLVLGAVRDGNALLLALEAAKPWKGTLVFDQPRHRTVMKLPLDYPRINQFPEWFTVEGDASYAVEGLQGGPRQLTGRDLQNGLPVSLAAGNVLHLRVTRTD